MTDGTGLPGDPLRAPCDRCPDGHTDPRTKPWGVRLDDRPEAMRGDGAYSVIRVERSDGGHVADADATWLSWLIHMTPFLDADHWPKIVRESVDQPERYWVTCACGHSADAQGLAQLRAWYHAHVLFPALYATELAQLLAPVLDREKSISEG